MRLVGKHYTPGRGGARIEYVTRHHLAGNLTIDQTWNVWQTRPASAHYVVENSGRIGQIVWDRDTAWSNANAYSNARSVSIEHANSGGADYPISPTVIREGAKLAAALCWFYKLGRPVFGKNIRDHREFTSTSCPYHLANGGKYHAEWMRIAGEHYDWMVANAPGTKPAPTPKEGPLMALSDAEQRELLDHVRYIRGQLGPWPQLGHNDKDQPLTLIDAVADSRRKAGHNKEK
ncbi:MAG TPA: N-acetylmuramoyl-L-alanine amidase [Actinomycetales bacterium]|nr:N-acetylmuramoyl-L-alanine amidase [Actinomycetales bacterium]